MNRQYNPRVITEGAMMAAIFVLLGLVSYYTPVGMLTMFTLSVPVAILTYRQGLRAAILSAMAGSAVLAAMIDPMVSSSVAMMQVMGIVIGWGLRKRYSPYLTLLAGTAVGIVGYLVAGLVSWYVMGINVVQQTIDLFRESSELSLSMFRSLNFPESQLEIIIQMQQMIEQYTIPMLPSILLISAAGLSFISLAIIREVLRRLGSPTEGLPPFSLWRFPPYLLWLFLLTFFGLWLTPPTQVAMRNLFTNLSNVANILFTMQGIAIAIFFMKKWGTPKFMQVVAVYMLGTMFFSLFMMLGLLDYTFDFRQIGPARRA